MTRKVLYLTVMALSGCLLMAAPASAATVFLGTADCDCGPMEGEEEGCYCYFDGSVDFSDPSHELRKVEFYVEQWWADRQTESFGHVGSFWLFSKCAKAGAIMRPVGSGPYTAQAEAFMVGQEMPVGDDTANWNPNG